MSRTATFVRRASLALSAAVLALAGSNAALGRRARPLPPSLPGEQRTYLWRGYRIAYTVAGAGSPILLVHSINGAASAYELRKTWHALSSEHRVYALDLLGCGGSERPDTGYSAALFTDLLLDFAQDVIGAPAGVIASSMSGSFMVAAADRAPTRWRKLLLVEPTGLQALSKPQGTAGRWVQSLVRSRLVGTFLFNLLVSRRLVRYFLADQTYHNPDFATPAVIEQSYQTAHQPGARFVPAAFLSGALNSDVTAAWQRLALPALIAWGRYAQPTPVQQAYRWTELNPAAQLVIFEQSGGLPHDEEATAFNRLATEFFAA